MRRAFRSRGGSQQGCHWTQEVTTGTPQQDLVEKVMWDLCDTGGRSAGPLVALGHSQVREKAGGSSRGVRVPSQQLRGAFTGRWAGGERGGLEEEALGAGPGQCRGPQRACSGPLQDASAEGVLCSDGCSLVCLVGCWELNSGP